MRLTTSDICPSTAFANRLRTLNDGHPKELRAHSPAFYTQRDHSSAQLGTIVLLLPPHCALFGGFCFPFAALMTRFAKSHIYIPSYWRGTVGSVLIRPEQR